MKIIGRRELVSMPELGFTDVIAKVDTGAYTSSMHCQSMVEEGSELHCEFFDPNSVEKSLKRVTFAAFSKKNVRSSNGQMESRYTITTPLTITNETYMVAFTLTDRSNMKFPLLLGRKFLRKKFIVDVSLINNLA